MENGNSIWSQIRKAPVCGCEAALEDTIIEIVGQGRVLIENHRGVVAYGNEKILVNVKFGCVSICGENLTLIHMTKDQLIIRGVIHAVALQRRGNH